VVVVKQLAGASLRMSQNLQTSDSTAVGRMGATTLASADELERKSNDLTALAGRLRQPGSWLSAAATVFINTAREQARSVLTISQLMHQLGQALNALAADLGAAKAEAMAAVAQSRQLDNAVSELNLRVSSFVMLPLGSDTPPGAEEEAARIANGQTSASVALWAAEHRAIEAWRRAGAAFDFVRDATPAMSKKWADPNWDPAEHVFQGKLTALSCGALAARGLPTGGMITGPNGKDYPLIVPQVLNIDGKWVTPSRESPATSDEWHEVAVRQGVTSFGYKASGVSQWAVALGGGAGAPYPEGSAFDKKRLNDIQILPDGGAYLPSPEDIPGGTVKEASAEAQRGKGNGVWVAPVRGLAAGKTSTAPDGIGLVVGAASGVLAALHLNDSRAARYRVVFEEDAAGNRQARMELYRVTNAPGAKEGVDIMAAYVDEHGELAGTPVTGEPAGVAAYAH
jgi:hypothetical protein